MARSYKNHNVETVEVDGNTFSRVVNTFTPVVKCRKIVNVSTSLDESGKQETKYKLVDIEKDGQVISFPMWKDSPDRPHYTSYNDESLEKAFSNYENALSFANDYAIHRKQELF